MGDGGVRIWEVVRDSTGLTGKGAQDRGCDSRLIGEREGLQTDGWGVGGVAAGPERGQKAAAGLRKENALE
ncbi:hypothetical protein KSP40_PGU011027 [Platanthera guangdongensis]|uniref:Uncharacterized protein n=1 Tax=Platanthera guangdongensis TaxID=2320717 RepID=A0ABR2MWX9_9ASPA